MKAARKMNKEDLIKKLEHLDLNEVELPGHRRRLRMALLNSGYWKGDITNMSLFKKVVPAGAIIAAVAIIVAIVFNINGTSEQVSAQEIAQKSYQAVSVLTDAEQDSLKKDLHAMDGPDELLDQALNAEDLAILTYDEFVIQYSDVVPPFLPGEGSADMQGIQCMTYEALVGQNIEPIDSSTEESMRNIKFIKFTDSDGVANIIGIDRESNLPVLAISWFTVTTGTAENTDEPGNVRRAAVYASDGEDGITVVIDDVEITLPTGTEPGDIQVIDGKIYVDGVEITPNK
jgi:hypothetical protein